MEYDHGYVFLGEIPNMLGHCIVMDMATSELFCGYHLDLFTELGEDEV